MSASGMSFPSGSVSVMDDLHDQISALAATIVNLDPSPGCTSTSTPAKRHGGGQCREVERLLAEAVEWLEQQEIEREWRAAGISRSKWAYAMKKTILHAIADKQLFAPWFKKPETWAAWHALLAALFGLPMCESDFGDLSRLHRPHRAPDRAGQGSLVDLRPARRQVLRPGADRRLPRAPSTTTASS